MLPVELVHAARKIAGLPAAETEAGNVEPLRTPKTFTFDISSPTARITPSGLAACPAKAAPSGPQVLLQNLPAPDDLAFDNDGRLLFSDIKTGDVSALKADGSVVRIAGGMSEPEGIVVQDDGHILVAEQSVRDGEQVLRAVVAGLRCDFQINHTTVQVEVEGCEVNDMYCKMQPVVEHEHQHTH